MATTKISRQQLVDAVESAIADQEKNRFGLTDRSKARLRQVARTATKVNRASFSPRSGACGCPATQAALYDEVIGPRAQGVCAFATKFDAFTLDFLPAEDIEADLYEGFYVLEVVEPTSSPGNSIALVEINGLWDATGYNPLTGRRAKVKRETTAAMALREAERLLNGETVVGTTR